MEMVWKKPRELDSVCGGFSHPKQVSGGAVSLLRFTGKYSVEIIFSCWDPESLPFST